MILLMTEVSKLSSKVYICHNNPTMPSPLPGNVEQCRGIASCIGSHAFTLSDGATIDAVDALVFCTGYEIMNTSLGFVDSSSSYMTCNF